MVLKNMTAEELEQFHRELCEWEEEFGINEITEEDLEKMAIEQGVI